MKLSYERKNSIALLAVCLGALMFGLEISSVPVILPTLEKVLHSNFRDMQWIMNAYTIACTTVLMAAGTLADRYGRKLIFIIGLIVFGVTSLICGLAEDTSVLIIGRFLQGMGGGTIMICSLAILSDHFQEGKARSRAFATWGIVFGIGLGFGPIIGGLLVTFASWQWVFLVHVPLAALTVFLVSFSVEESKDPDSKSLDIKGILTLSLSVFGLTYFITQERDLSFITSLVIIAVVVISFALFIYIEKTISHPMFDFSVFKIRNFSGAILGSIGMNYSFWPFIIYLPIYFQSALGYSIETAGLALLTYTLPTLVVPPLGERIALRYQPRIAVPFGLFTIGLGFMLMRIGNSAEHVSWITMFPGCLVAGIGLGLTNTPVTNTSTGSVPSTHAGMASGIDMSARLITLAVNIAVMGFILLEGVLSYIKAAFPGVFTTEQLRSIAEKIAAGNLSAVGQSFPSQSAEATRVAAHAALVHGFGNVMLFGGVCVWILALTSYLVFGPKKSSATQNIAALVPEAK